MRRTILAVFMLMLSGSLWASTQPFGGYALYESKDMEKKSSSGFYTDVQKVSVSLIQEVGSATPTAIQIRFDGSMPETFPIQKDSELGCGQKLYVAGKQIGSPQSDVYLWTRVRLTETQPGKCRGGIPGTNRWRVVIESKELSWSPDVTASMELEGSAVSTDVNGSID